MKKFIIAILTISFSTPLSFAASYPASCPSEAKAIVEAVGGCSSVNKTQYPAIYEKCCAVAATKPVPTPKSAPAPTPTLSPTIPPKQPTPPSYTEPVREVLQLNPATKTQEVVAPAPQAKNLLNTVKESFQQIINRFFRFLRLR